MTREEWKKWAFDHAKRAAPFVLTGFLTLATNAVIQSSGVSESCQNEIRGWCARMIEKVIARV